MIDSFKTLIRKIKRKKEHRRNVKRYHALCAEIDALIVKHRSNQLNNTGHPSARAEGVIASIELRRGMLETNMKPPVQEDLFSHNLQSLQRNFASLDWIINYSEL